MKRRYALISLMIFPLLASAEPSEPSKPEAPAPKAAPRVKLATSKGDIILELNAEKAPITTTNFLSYVEKKHYDGTVFHRVIDGFMIQGGGFALQDGNLVEKETGKGIANEGQNGLGNKRGTVAMARTSDPNSATAQFFINVADNGMLDFPNHGGYAVFGKVVEGMDVVDRIKAAATDTTMLEMRHPATGEKVQAPAGDVPKEHIIIQSASLVEPGATH
jgi:peptidyl-prolyl cis-trans isomerase A (cyclophilin A)